MILVKSRRETSAPGGVLREGYFMCTNEANEVGVLHVSRYISPYGGDTTTEYLTVKLLSMEENSKHLMYHEKDLSGNDILLSYLPKFISESLVFRKVTVRVEEYNTYVADAEEEFRDFSPLTPFVTEDSTLKVIWMMLDSIRQLNKCRVAPISFEEFQSQFTPSNRISCSWISMMTKKSARATLLG